LFPSLELQAFNPLNSQELFLIQKEHHFQKSFHSFQTLVKKKFEKKDHVVVHYISMYEHLIEQQNLSFPLTDLVSIVDKNPEMFPIQSKRKKAQKKALFLDEKTLEQKEKEAKEQKKEKKKKNQEKEEDSELSEEEQLIEYEDLNDYNLGYEDLEKEELGEEEEEGGREEEEVL